MTPRGRLASQLCALVIIAAAGRAWGETAPALPQEQAVPNTPPAPEEQPSIGPAPAPAEPPGLPPPPIPPLEPLMARRVAAIEFRGNKRTRPEVMLQEIGLAVGQPATTAQIEASRQAIMDLGLFEWVTAMVERTPEGEKVIFGVKEKFYFIPIPLLSGDPSKHDYSYGMELRADNLGGWNQGVRVKYENDQSASKANPLTHSGSVTYVWPRISGSPYSMEAGYALAQQDFNLLDSSNNITASYHRNITNINLGASRWLNFDDSYVGSHGWSAGAGINYQQQAYNFLSGTPAAYRTSEAMSLTASIGWNDVHDKGNYFTGSAYGWRAELGDRFLGSDYDFTRHLFYYRLYDPLTPESNLNWQLRIGFADGHPFEAPAYSIGGYNTLRGYETAHTGNAIALSNLEYHHQLGGYPSVRGIWFLDLGNTYRNVTDMNPGKLEAGSGLGVRWRIRSLVNVTLAADAAWGFGPQKKVFYLMTTSTF